MALQDRDYYRAEGEGQNGIDATMLVVRLILVYAAVYLSNLLAGPDFKLVEKYLALHGDALARPLEWYQFLTAGWAYDAGAVGAWLWAMLGLFVFGRDVEDRLGPWEFLRFFVFAQVVGHLAWGVSAWLRGQTGLVFGAAGGLTAVVLLSCLRQPLRRINVLTLFRVPAWAVGLVVLATNALIEANTSPLSMLTYELYLAGGIFSLAYWRLRWNFGRWWTALGGRQMDFSSWFKPQSNVRLHEPEDEHDEDWDENLEVEADQLLEKVHAQGADSLTLRERRILEEYSRRVRAKRR